MRAWGKTFSSILDANKGVGPGFDTLRILLAFAIFWGHAKSIAGGHPLHVDSLAALHAGNWEGPRRPMQVAYVPAFFALSGFLVTGSALRLRQTSTFLLFRGFRIFPALLVEVTLSALILGGAFTTLSPGAYFTSAGLFRYFGNVVGWITFYLPGVFTKNPWAGVVNVNLWTLPAEFDCYLGTAVLMATGIFFNRRIVSAVFVLVTLVFAFLNISTDFAVSPMTMAPIAVTYYFFVGVMFFHWRERVNYSAWLFLGSCLAAYPLLYWHHTVFLAPVFLTYATLFIGMSAIPKIALISRGDYSYGIYLYGFPITQALVAAIPSLHGRGWSTLALAAIVTAAFAAFSWHVVEKPALGLRKKLPKWMTGERNRIVIALRGALPQSAPGDR
jgi:peptidoglycan/LPS O-acetylase OafA/YrhL